MRTKLTILACAAGFITGVPACAPDADTNRDAGTPAPSDTAPAIEDPPLPTAPEPRAETVRDTLLLEGMPEPVTLRLYESPPEAPVPFSVYLPPTFGADIAESGDLRGVRFAADFAGTGDAPGRLDVLFHPPGTTESDARAALATAAAESGDPRTTEGPPFFPWAIEERSFTTTAGGARTLGTVALGRHGERYFRVIMSYPETWSEGFVPRVNLMLDTWRWGDGGRLTGSTGR